MRTDLRVEEKRETRVDEKTVIGIDQSGRWQIDPVEFEIEEPAEPRPDVALKRVERERFVDLIEKILGRERGCCQRNKEAEDLEGLHATSAEVATAGRARRKRTSNSVQSSSERTRRKSPP